MSRLAILAAALLVAAGCATPADPAEMAERQSRPLVTGSHIKQKVRPGDNRGVETLSREELERQQDKAPGTGRDPYK